MDHEVGYIRAELRMVHEPVVESAVAAQEKEGGEQQERGRREYGQEYAQNSQTEGNESQYGQKYSHHKSVPEERSKFIFIYREIIILFQQSTVLE